MTKEIETTWRVGGHTDAKQLAAALGTAAGKLLGLPGSVQSRPPVIELVAIGVQATYQAVKALAIARQRMHGFVEFVVRPGFVDRDNDAGEERTAIVLAVTFTRVVH